MRLVALGLALGLATSIRGVTVGGPEVAVSRLPGAQNEPAIAIDPANPRVLLAGSNSFREGAMRVYSSVDGGERWSASFVYAAPRSFLTTCASDPAVAIDDRGRQYYAFIRTTPCRTGHPQLFVASRAGPTAPWRPGVLVAPLRASLSDDKPAIAVDRSPSSPHRGRVYVAWSRLSRNGVVSIVLSSSGDGGRHWSRIVKVNQTGRDETYTSVAVSRSGVVYVAWDDPSGYRLAIARSSDGGRHFEPERDVEVFTIVPIPSCGSGIVIPALPFGCLHADPTVAVGRSGRVYVSYAKGDFEGDKGVYVRVFDARLRPLGPSRPVAPAPPKVRPDQFWPAMTIDGSTGAIWLCFYDTAGDPARKSAFYSCTVSRDGARTWAPRVHASSVASDETVADADVRAYGDYTGVAAAGGVAHPIWTDSRDLADYGEEIYTTRLTEADFGR